MSQNIETIKIPNNTDIHVKIHIQHGSFFTEAWSFLKLSLKGAIYELDHTPSSGYNEYCKNCIIHDQLEQLNMLRHFEPDQFECVNAHDDKLETC